LNIELLSAPSRAQAPTAARARTFQLPSKRANPSGGNGLLK
jgi:hypothetical protein